MIGTLECNSGDFLAIPVTYVSKDSERMRSSPKSPNMPCSLDVSWIVEDLLSGKH